MTNEKLEFETEKKSAMQIPQKETNSSTTKNTHNSTAIDDEDESDCKTTIEKAIKNEKDNRETIAKSLAELDLKIKIGNYEQFKESLENSLTDNENKVSNLLADKEIKILIGELAFYKSEFSNIANWLEINLHKSELLNRVAKIREVLENKKNQHENKKNQHEKDSKEALKRLNTIKKLQERINELKAQEQDPNIAPYVEQFIRNAVVTKSNDLKNPNWYDFNWYARKEITPTIAEYILDQFMSTQTDRELCVHLSRKAIISNIIAKSKYKIDISQELNNLAKREPGLLISNYRKDANRYENGFNDVKYRDDFDDVKRGVYDVVDVERYKGDLIDKNIDDILAQIGNVIVITDATDKESVKNQQQKEVVEKISQYAEVIKKEQEKLRKAKVLEEQQQKQKEEERKKAKILEEQWQKKERQREKLLEEQCRKAKALKEQRRKIIEEEQRQNKGKSEDERRNNIVKDMVVFRTLKQMVDVPSYKFRFAAATHLKTLNNQLFIEQESTYKEVFKQDASTTAEKYLRDLKQFEFLFAKKKQMESWALLKNKWITLNWYSESVTMVGKVLHESARLLRRSLAEKGISCSNYLVRAMYFAVDLYSALNALPEYAPISDFILQLLREEVQQFIETYRATDNNVIKYNNMMRKIDQKCTEYLINLEKNKSRIEKNEVDAIKAVQSKIYSNISQGEYNNIFSPGEGEDEYVDGIGRRFLKNDQLATLESVKKRMQEQVAAMKAALKKETNPELKITKKEALLKILKGDLGCIYDKLPKENKSDILEYIQVLDDKETYSELFDNKISKLDGIFGGDVATEEMLVKFALDNLWKNKDKNWKQLFDVLNTKQIKIVQDVFITLADLTAAKLAANFQAEATNKLDNLWKENNWAQLSKTWKDKKVYLDVANSVYMPLEGTNNLNFVDCLCKKIKDKLDVLWLNSNWVELSDIIKNKQIKIAEGFDISLAEEQLLIINGCLQAKMKVMVDELIKTTDKTNLLENYKKTTRLLTEGYQLHDIIIPLDKGSCQACNLLLNEKIKLGIKELIRSEKDANKRYFLCKKLCEGLPVEEGLPELKFTEKENKSFEKIMKECEPQIIKDKLGKLLSDNNLKELHDIITTDTVNINDGNDKAVIDLVVTNDNQELVQNVFNKLIEQATNLSEINGLYVKYSNEKYFKISNLVDKEFKVSFEKLFEARFIKNYEAYYNAYSHSYVMYDCADTEKKTISTLAENNRMLVCFWEVNKEGILSPAKGYEKLAELLLNTPKLQQQCWQIFISGDKFKILEKDTTTENVIKNKYSLLKPYIKQGGEDSFDFFWSNALSVHVSGSDDEIIASARNNAKFTFLKNKIKDLKEEQKLALAGYLINYKKDFIGEYQFSSAGQRQFAQWVGFDNSKGDFKDNKYQDFFKFIYDLEQKIENVEKNIKDFVLLVESINSSKKTSVEKCEEIISRRGDERLRTLYLQLDMLPKEQKNKIRKNLEVVVNNINKLKQGDDHGCTYTQLKTRYAQDTLDKGNDALASSEMKSGGHSIAKNPCKLELKKAPQPFDGVTVEVRTVEELKMT